MQLGNLMKSTQKQIRKMTNQINKHINLQAKTITKTTIKQIQEQQ